MHSHSTDLTPRPLNTPLAWTDFVYTLQDALASYPSEAAIYIVGGAVRDAWLRRPIPDLDLATDGGGRKLAKWLANHFGGAYFPLDAERDVGRSLLTIDEQTISLDVAALRGDLAADLLDRDFTINAMAVDLRGDLNLVIDPTGGAADLRDKVLRRCTPDSIAKDPVRIIRAVRQSVQFGFRIERETLHDLRANLTRLSVPSIERVRDQWFRLFSLPRPGQALRVADSIGVLTASFPELAALRDQARLSLSFDVVDRLMELLITISPRRSDETAAQFSLGMFVMALDRYRARLQEHLSPVYADGRSHHAALVFAALIHALPKQEAAALVERLRLSNVEQDLILKLVSGWEPVRNLPTDPVSIYRFWKTHGAAGIDVILLGMARVLGEESVGLRQDEWLAQVEHKRILLSAWFDEPDRFVNPPPLLDGNDLKRELGIGAGPLIGEALERIREGQVAGTIRTRGEALLLARAVLRRDESDPSQ